MKAGALGTRIRGERTWTQDLGSWLELAVGARIAASEVGDIVELDVQIAHS